MNYDINLFGTGHVGELNDLDETKDKIETHATNLAQ